MKDLFTPPELVDPLAIGWVILAVIILLALFTSIAATAVSSIYIGSAIAAAIAVIPEFRILRAVAPDQTWLNVGLWAAFIVVPAGIALLIAHQTESYHRAFPAVAAGGLGAGSVVIAALADSVNERLAVIPLSWGVVLVVLVGGGLYAFSSNNR